MRPTNSVNIVIWTHQYYSNHAIFWSNVEMSAGKKRSRAQQSVQTI